MAGASVAVGHVALLAVLLAAQPDRPAVVDPPPMMVQLVTLLPDPPPPQPPAPEPPKPKVAPTKAVTPPKKTKPDKPPPRRIAARPARPSPDVAPLLAMTGPSADGDDIVSDAQLAGAGTAESGGGGGGACNMTRRLQTALRKDARVQAAIASAHRGRAIRIWNGDWVRHPGQEGNGLAAVREAIMWEVGFAPAACRTEPVHGLVLISLNDSAGAARIVVGQGSWRWSDMLGLRR